MSSKYSAQQFETAFHPARILNYEIPKPSLPTRPNQRCGFTRFQSSNDGRRLGHIKESPNMPWGNFVGTWDLPKKIPGPRCLVNTARSNNAINKLQREQYKLDDVIQGRIKCAKFYGRANEINKNVIRPGRLGSLSPVHQDPCMPPPVLCKDDIDVKLNCSQCANQMENCEAEKIHVDNQLKCQNENAALLDVELDGLNDAQMNHILEECNPCPSGQIKSVKNSSPPIPIHNCTEQKIVPDEKPFCKPCGITKSQFDFVPSPDQKCKAKCQQPCKEYNLTDVSSPNRLMRFMSPSDQSLRFDTAVEKIAQCSSKNNNNSGPVVYINSDQSPPIIYVPTLDEDKEYKTNEESGHIIICCDDNSKTKSDLVVSKKVSFKNNTKNNSQNKNYNYNQEKHHPQIDIEFHQPKHKNNQTQVESEFYLPKQENYQPQMEREFHQPNCNQEKYHPQIDIELYRPKHQTQIENEFHLLEHENYQPQLEREFHEPNINREKHHPHIDIEFYRPKHENNQTQIESEFHLPEQENYQPQIEREFHQPMQEQNDCLGMPHIQKESRQQKQKQRDSNVMQQKIRYSHEQQPKQRYSQPQHQMSSQMELVGSSLSKSIAQSQGSSRSLRNCVKKSSKMSPRFKQSDGFYQNYTPSYLSKTNKMKKRQIRCSAHNQLETMPPRCLSPVCEVPEVDTANYAMATAIDDEVCKKGACPPVLQHKQRPCGTFLADSCAQNKGFAPCLADDCIDCPIDVCESKGLVKICPKKKSLDHLPSITLQKIEKDANKFELNNAQYPSTEFTSDKFCKGILKGYPNPASNQTFCKNSELNFQDDISQLKNPYCGNSCDGSSARRYDLTHRDDEFERVMMNADSVLNEICGKGNRNVKVKPKISNQKMDINCISGVPKKRNTSKNLAN